MGPRSRRLLFAGWTCVASFLLLEGALQVGALLARPEAAPPLGEPVDGPAEFTVLAVGDSWVAGAEADPGQGFVERLDRSLSAVDGRPVRVVNRGRSGANSAHVALAVLDEAEPLGADVIVVLVGQNNATNFARVAEVEQRLAIRRGLPAEEPSPRFQLRTGKLARLVWANVRGTEGYASQLPSPAAPPPPPIPPMLLDDEGAPRLAEPLLESPAGAAYLARAVLEPTPSPSGPDAAAWAVLFDAAARRAPAPESLAALRVQSRSPESGVLPHYALLRAAREAGDWAGVRTHGAALAASTPRGALTDLGAAEAALLRGDWPAARALLLAASHRAPGFADVLDLACRFPAEAADVEVQEACEQAPWAEHPTALDEARVADGTLDPAAAAAARERWLSVAPWDLGTRVDLALWYAHIGAIDRADALMGYQGDARAPMPAPVRPDPDHWRYFVSRNAELGDPDRAVADAEQALAETTADRPDAGVLQAVAHVFAEYERCEALPGVVERWYRVRGDVPGAARALGRCLSPDASADAIARWRGVWGADASPSSFEALARAGNHLALLERDLDLVLEEARRIEATVVLLDYPNPSADHAALARLIEEYAGSRGIQRVAMRDAFAARFSPDQWAALLGPNGHCNGEGYAVMAELLAPRIERIAAARSTP